MRNSVLFYKLLCASTCVALLITPTLSHAADVHADLDTNRVARTVSSFVQADAECQIVLGSGAERGEVQACALEVMRHRHDQSLNPYTMKQAKIVCSNHDGVYYPYAMSVTIKDDKDEMLQTLDSKSDYDDCVATKDYIKKL